MNGEIGLRVLGCDPGKINFGWAVYGPSGLETSGVMKGAQDVHDLDDFLTRFSQLVQKTRPNFLCIERYTRQIGGTKNLELFNLMIGSAMTECLNQKIPVFPITASTHKTWTSKHFEVQQREKKTRRGRIQRKWDIRTYKEWENLPTEHEVDAANVAKYGHDYLIPKKFDKEASKK